MELHFLRVRDVKHPDRGTSRSSGIDFFVPYDFGGVTLYPGESVKIPSGIHAKMTNCMMIAFNKSGVAVNKSLIVGAEVIDEDYQGEIHIHVINVGSDIQQIDPGDKLVQFLVFPTWIVDYTITSDLKPTMFYESTTERNAGGFGSTGIR